MTAEVKQKIQLVLALAIVVAGIRTAYILYERHQERAQPAEKQAAPLDPDYYVTPKNLYPYDLKSAQALTIQPVWVKVGYAVTYFPYDETTHHAAFTHPAGTFLPIEKLQVRRVVTDTAPGADDRQVMAIFEKNGRTYAFAVGSVAGDTFYFIVNDLLFFQDPHLLYNHWPAEFWQAIDTHQIIPGMNELQASMALGLGIPRDNGDPGSRTLKYPNGGHPMTVRFAGGKAVEINSGGLASLCLGHRHCSLHRDLRHAGPLLRVHFTLGEFSSAAF
jgi:hypothetical protein